MFFGALMRTYCSKHVGFCNDLATRIWAFYILSAWIVLLFFKANIVYFSLVLLNSNCPFNTVKKLIALSTFGLD